MTVNLKNNTIFVSSVLGEFSSDQNYLDDVDLLISSTLETQHRDQILIKQIIPRLKSRINMLDIGVGNGELTKFIGLYYKTITVVDNSRTSLDNLPDYYPTNETKIDKIYGSVLLNEIPAKNYDLILLSHVLYYIEPEKRGLLVKKLSQLLSDDGVMVLIFNEGMSRYELTKHFGGKNFEFDELIYSIYQDYKFVQMISSKEIIQTNNTAEILAIAGVCLKDAGVTANREEVEEYLNLTHYNDNTYHIDMIQEIIVIGELNGI
jgi:2-polyprenyl-3-methyl-5-hydroxy-6-metoxy-1,4-benzoquinol methylase